MSLDVKQFVQNVINWVKGGEQAVEHDLQQYIPQALHISTIFAQLLTNPVVDGVLTLAVGANVEAEIEKIATQVVKDLTTVENILALPTVQQQLAALAQLIASSRTPDDADSFLSKLASLVLKYLDGNKEPQHIYDLATQAAYSASKAS